jgi:phosphoserine phosphatase
MHTTAKTIFATFLAATAACGGDDPKNNTPDAAVDAHVTPDAPPQPMPCGTLVPSTIAADPAWFGTNRQDVEAWLESAGCRSAKYDPTHKPLALFDWDNTLSKNDFGDAITFHMISHGLVVQPPNHDWTKTSAFMTPAAAAALELACGTTTPDGAVLHTDTNTACADEMINIYMTSGRWETTPAFAGWNGRWIEPTYAWTAQLLAGYTHAQIQQFMIDAVTPQLTAAMNSMQTVGTITGLNAWLRIYDQQKEVVKAAQTRGYDVWIITASPQDAIAAVSNMVGIAPDHVIGIHSMTDGSGKLTYRFEGCGELADGQGEMISYIQGKRCFVNKFVYGDTTAKAIDRRPDGQRQVFAAGDSDTDVEFLRDATYKFILNRNKKELMCNAYDNDNDSWRINPMFILPKGPASPYPCPTTACKDENGAPIPCRDLGANIIKVQTDTAHL